MNGTFMQSPRDLALPVILFAALLMSGCRSYGGYGAEEATYRQMQVAHQIFEEELVRAKADLRKLEAAASDNPILSVPAAQYAEMVQGHETVLDDQENMISGLSDGSGYRDLHRAFAAMVSQQRTIRNQYERLLSNVQRFAASADTTVQTERPYSFIPPYFERVAGRQRELSVNGVLATLRSGASAEFPDMTADTSAAPAGIPGTDENGETP